MNDDFVLLPQEDGETDLTVPLPGGSANERLLKDINDVLEAHCIAPWTMNQLGIANKCEVIGLNGFTTLNQNRVKLNLRIRRANGEESETGLNVGGRFVFVVPVVNVPTGVGAARRDNRCVHLLAESRLEGRMDGTAWLNVFTPSTAKGIEREFDIRGLSWEVPRKLLMKFDESRERDPKYSPAHEVLRSAIGEAYVDAMEWAAVLPMGVLRLKSEFSMARVYYLESTFHDGLDFRALSADVMRVPVGKVTKLLNRLTGIADAETISVLASTVLKNQDAFK